MPALESLYANLITNRFDFVQKIPYGAKTLEIILIILVAFIVLNILYKVFDRLIRRTVNSNQSKRPKSERKQRADTLVGVVNMTTRIVGWLLVAFIVLSELGLDIGPLLAGAGIAGVALGFGAQNMVRDFLAGLFVLIEDQYSVGDVVEVAGKSGLVQDISLRKTVLRDLDGLEHHIPNGEIKTASNYTKDFSRVNLNLSVAYESDLEKVMKVINKVGKNMAKDKEWKDVILEAPHTLGVDKFGDYAIEIKTLAETKPLKQWDVMREFRKRIKVAFDKNDIEIPYPKRVSVPSKN